MRAKRAKSQIRQADAAELHVVHVHEVGHVGVGALLTVGVVPDAEVTLSKSSLRTLFVA